jgi:hypothetical protein
MQCSLYLLPLLILSKIPPIFFRWWLFDSFHHKEVVEKQKQKKGPHKATRIEK